MYITEQQRNDAFKACPILSGFLSCALEDLQYSESDQAHMEEREERDSGTIYDCPDSVFEWARQHCERFMRECADDIEQALSLTGDEFESHCRHDGISHERLGSTLYLASVGHGVTFTDDGNAPCLERLAQWARANQREGLYFGDDGSVYHV